MLQGSLADFALIEILGLLAETTKSGRLHIDGDRGKGVLAFSSGKLAAAQVSSCDDTATPEDVMFELLRFQEGSFAFSNQELELNGDEKNVSAVLSVAESRLAEWNAIAAVVPSMGHLVSPVSDLPQDEVTINREEWAALSVISAGCPVSIVCDELSLGEVEGCRKIKHLIERKLVQLSMPAGASPKLPPNSRMTEQKALEPAPATSPPAGSALRPPLQLAPEPVAAEPKRQAVARPSVGSKPQSQAAAGPPATARPSFEVAAEPAPALRRARETAPEVAPVRAPAQQAIPPAGQDDTEDSGLLATPPSASSGAESLVASLRGDFAAGEAAIENIAPPAPPVSPQGPENRNVPAGEPASASAGVSTLPHKADTQSGDDEGLLMRYLKGQTD